ncbi:hypothetical protein [Sorangium sp. So ce861]|uniref:hypothetical protein n=1 Tax=Sorangium sp. So ce861 TaxID=3133323 RepID=UPI003F645198
MTLHSLLRVIVPALVGSSRRSHGAEELEEDEGASPDTRSFRACAVIEMIGS